MKKVLFFLLVSFAIVGCQNNANQYKPTDNPKKLVQQIVIQDAPIWASQAFRSLHKAEIKKTLMVNETIEAGMLRAIFYSYSIGADVVRDVQWAVAIEGKLYPVIDWNLDDNAEEYESNKSEIKLIKQKANQWEQNPGRFWAD